MSDNQIADKDRITFFSYLRSTI